MNDQFNKSGIIERLQAERAHFETALAQMSEAQMAEVPVQDEWTAKDIVAHLAAWERECLDWFEAAACGESPDLPEPGSWGPYMDQFNARIFAENRNRPLADVLADSRQVYAQFLAALRALPEDSDDALWSVWQDGAPPWGLLATFYEHYWVHRKPIQAWLNREHE